MSEWIGAERVDRDRCRFRVWAPRANQVEIVLLDPERRLISLDSGAGGYHEGQADRVAPGSRYLFRLDGRLERPDPASRSQPDSVHGPSRLVEPDRFEWTCHDWKGRPLEEYILYEIHVGTYTPEGTFDGVAGHLDELCDLGVTAIELMPIAQFPGQRNWGYDGVYPYAVQDSYGGPQGLKRLVDACHLRGIAVVLDVVYNHLGPEGNYLSDFGPYFTDRYQTPWGRAVNFDGPDSDEVRRYFIGSALFWITEFRIDALRIDAIHGIYDASASPFLKELADAVHRRAEETGRAVWVIAESDLNDPRVIRPADRGGFGHDAQWNDDFHHALHVLLTGERNGYYLDFDGIEDLLKAYREGFVVSGGYSAYRKRRHGSWSGDLPAEQFVVFSQNHDQTGNRLLGERLSELVAFEALKVAAGAVLLSPYLPLLFMGEEYGEIARFPYFISHSDPDLVEAVRRGRAADFAAFGWSAPVPDPQSEETFLSAKLDHRLRRKDPHKKLHAFYRELLSLRRRIPALGVPTRVGLELGAAQPAQGFWMLRARNRSRILALFNLGETPIDLEAAIPPSDWKRELDSSAEAWGGIGGRAPERLDSGDRIAVPLNPISFALYLATEEGGGG